MSAQVTSLIWNEARREIAATLGYANPEHPIRIIVLEWPTLTYVVQVPWQEDMRALYGVFYPGGPAISEGLTRYNYDTDDVMDANERLLIEVGAREPRGGRKERSCVGCIVVAASDETVRFHEIWAEGNGGVGAGVGVLGGSEILEGLEGIEREGRETIR